MISVPSPSRYITSTSRYNPRYKSRSSMYIRGPIPWNFVELAEAVPIVLTVVQMNMDMGLDIGIPVFGAC